MTATDLGTFLLVEGALVTGLCLARIICLRLVALDAAPAPVRSWIERGTRLVPAVLALAVATVVVGAVIRIVAS
ncbi:hypothetical protein GCM10022237_34190 [Nocardioides ginsengisoli]|uniref:Uncharacterized protein n=1 Tax=Nocardioides ginsengisoli TaxID=363868 RepID=A0ABW3VWZ5_9ACTN